MKTFVYLNNTSLNSTQNEKCYRQKIKKIKIYFMYNKRFSKIVPFMR